jgi:hypothetical protein
VAIVAVGLWGCGGSSPPPEAAPEPSAEPAPAAEPAPEPTAEPAKTEGESARPSANAVEPEFKPGMTVEEAIAAVPKDTQRVNVDQEVLSEPLLKPELYAPCSPKGHFSLRVAIWDGRVVGVDVTTKPKNEKLESCLKDQLATVAYKDKAKSLNTVEFSM